MVGNTLLMVNTYDKTYSWTFPEDVSLKIHKYFNLIQSINGNYHADVSDQFKNTQDLIQLTGLIYYLGLMDEQVIKYFGVSREDMNIYLEELEKININMYKNTSNIQPSRPSMYIHECYILNYHP